MLRAQKSRFCVVRSGLVAGLAGLALIAVAGTLAAQVSLQPCARVVEANHVSAIAAAEAWRAQRWANTRKGWTTDYQVPPPPPAPLGIGLLARGQELGASHGPSAPIAGVAAVAKMACLSGPPEPDGRFVVHFVGNALRFNENKQGWSRPLRTALLHALVVGRPTVDAAWVVTEQPEAPTALIPGAHLSPSMPAVLPTVLPRAAATTTRPRR